MCAQINKIINQSNNNIMNALQQQEHEMQAKSAEWERHMQQEVEKMMVCHVQ